MALRAWALCVGLSLSASAAANSGSPTGVDRFCHDVQQRRVLYVFHTGADEAPCSSHVEVFGRDPSRPSDPVTCFDPEKGLPGCVPLPTVDLARSAARATARPTGKTSVGRFNVPACTFEVTVNAAGVLRRRVELDCALSQRASLTAFALPDRKEAVIVLTAPFAAFSRNQVLGTVALAHKVPGATATTLEAKLTPQALADAWFSAAVEFESRGEPEQAWYSIKEANRVGGARLRPEWRFREAVLATLAGKVDAALEPLAVALSFAAAREGLASQLAADPRLKSLREHPELARCAGPSCVAQVPRPSGTETLEFTDGVGRLLRQDRWERRGLVDRGALVERYDVVDAGYWRWSSTGRLLAHGARIAGKREGPYYESLGVTVLRSNYRGDVKHGIEREELPDGGLLRVTEFRDGVEHGLAMEFRDGRPSSANTMRAGRPEGPFVREGNAPDERIGGVWFAADGGAATIYTWRKGTLAVVEQISGGKRLLVCTRRPMDAEGCCLGEEVGPDTVHAVRWATCCGAQPQEPEHDDGGSRALCERLHAIPRPAGPPAFPPVPR